MDDASSSPGVSGKMETVLAPTAELSKTRRWQGLQGRQIHNLGGREGGRERDSLCRNTSATANLSDVVQILQNIHTTGIWQLQTLPNSRSGNRVARKADTNYLKLGLAYFPCDSTSEALHY